LHPNRIGNRHLSKVILKTLLSRGFDLGPADNVFSAKTKAVFLKCQKDNGLLVGNFDQ
jgi:hypothetical protein